MKRIYIYIIALLAFTSCDSFLDVIPDDRAEIKTEDQIKKLLVYAYSNTSQAYALEMVSDNTDKNLGNWRQDGIFQEEAFYWKDIKERANDGTGYIWEGNYKAIANANYALEAIEKLGGGAKLDPLKGEALLARAFAHYNLVTTFAKMYGSTSASDPGITYMTKPETTVNPNYDRGTVAETYAKILADIEAGLPLITNNTFDVPKYHFNKKAAYAFAARFCLFYQKFDKTIEYANLALGSNPSGMLRDWAVNQTLPVGVDGARENYYVSKDRETNFLLLSTISIWPRVLTPSSYAVVFAHNSLIGDNETTGSTGPWGRFQNYKFRHTRLINPKLPLVKFVEYFETLDPIAGTGRTHMVYPVFTADETLLCRAEAYALLGNYNNGLEDLNMLIKSFVNNPNLQTQASLDNFYGGMAYYTPQQPTAKKELDPDFTIPAGSENLIHGILHLRRIMTIHEGLRWLDVNRYGIVIYRREVNALAGNTIDVVDTLLKGDPRRAIQIPYDAIEAGLESNERDNESQMIIDPNIIIKE